MVSRRRYAYYAAEPCNLPITRHDREVSTYHRTDSNIDRPGGSEFRTSGTVVRTVSLKVSSLPSDSVGVVITVGKMYLLHCTDKNKHAERVLTPSSLLGKSCEASSPARQAETEPVAPRFAIPNNFRTSCHLYLLLRWYLTAQEGFRCFPPTCSPHHYPQQGLLFSRFPVAWGTVKSRRCGDDRPAENPKMLRQRSH